MIMSNCERLNDLLLKSGKYLVCVFLAFLFNIVLVILDNQLGKKLKERGKLFLLVECMIIYKEYPTKSSKKFLGLL